MEYSTSRPFPSAIVTLLASTTLFGGLDEAALRAVETELEWIHLPGGGTLCCQGDTGDCLYLVITGRLRLTVTSPEGNERFVGEVGRGDSVGEMAILTGEPRSATVRAIRDTELVKFSQAGFDRLVEKHPQTMRQLARMLALRLQQRSSASRESKTFTTVALIPTSADVPLSEFANRLAAAFAPLGPTLHLSSDRLEGILGSGAAQATQDTAQGSRITSWLNEQEARYQFILYEVDPDLSAWTSRCIRQADRLLVVGCAEAEPTAGEIEAALPRLSPGRTPRRMELALIHRAQPRQPSGTHEQLALRRVDFHYHVRLDSTADFARLARFLASRTVGLVLSGGAARGFAHIGVIRALMEAKVPIDCIGGASMGAVIAAQYALGWDYKTMLGMNRKGWIESRLLTDYTIPVVSLIVGRKVRKMLAMMFGDARIEDLWLPYFCVSSNLTRATLMVHREGPLWKWVHASISVPGIVPPLLEQGNLLVDGSVLNNLPADVMRSLCAGRVIAVNVSPQVDLTLTPADCEGLSAWQLLRSQLKPFADRLPAPNIFDILLRSATLSSEYALENVKSQVDLYLQPPVGQFRRFEWKALEQLADIGYRYAQQQIAEWKHHQ